MRKANPMFTAERIRHLYWDENLSGCVIASQLNCSGATISRIMKKLGILARTNNQATRLAVETGRRFIKRRWLDKEGRVRIPNGERHGRGYRYEHRIVWEQAHGQPLPKGWVIHHLNGIPSDNRPENLIAYPTTAKHSIVIPLLKAKIRRLEAENTRLRKAFSTGQLSLPQCSG